MSLFQSPVDEVRVLTGGVDVFSVLYARAQAAHPRAIWVEGFGTVKGASIIELTGDKHRESVREATLNHFSATITSDGERQDVRSVATLSWREKRAQRSLTGFLASALATHVTLRIREVEILRGEDATTIDVSGAASASKAEEKRASKPAQERRKTSAKASKPRQKSTQKQRQESAPSYDDIPIHRPPAPSISSNQKSTAEPAAKKSESPAQSVGWGDLEGASDAVQEDAAAPKSVVGWGDVAQASEQAERHAAPKQAGAPKIQPAQQSLIDGIDAPADGWGDVAALSESMEKTTTPTAAKTLKRGEVLVHPKLGDCTIINVMSETVVMVKPRGGRARKISLKPFVVTETERRGFYALTRG